MGHKPFIVEDLIFTFPTQLCIVGIWVFCDDSLRALQ